MRPRFHWLFIVYALTSTVSFLQLKADDSDDYRLLEDIPYAQDPHPRQKLDLYFPTGAKGFPIVVWFHGGGLRAGSKSIPELFKNQGFAVAAANYRLFPEAKSPEYIEDAASAVAWVFENISRHGGDSNSIFVAGHSAGGYLTSMVGFDKSYLAAHGVDADNIAGLFPFSGHTITHFTPREERQIPNTRPIIDSLAPLYHTRMDAPPVVLLTGDRELEMLGRYEENAYFWRMLEVVGHPNAELIELEGFNHGEMAKPASLIVVKRMKQRINSINASQKLK